MVCGCSMCDLICWRLNFKFWFYCWCVICYSLMCYYCYMLLGRKGYEGIIGIMRELLIVLFYLMFIRNKVRMSIGDKSRIFEV